MSVVIQVIALLNGFMNIVGKIFIGPVISFLPGWLSNTVISAVIGVICIILFKYTSNQDAIARVRDKIKANMLALKLFKDDLGVTFRSQAKVMGASFMLLVHALVPMIIMMIPVVLFIAQMGLFYEFSPLAEGEEAMITLKVNGEVGSPLPVVSIQSDSSFEVVDGPVRLEGKREVWWSIKAEEAGYQKIIFDVDGEKVYKDLAIGDGFMRVNLKRAGQSFMDVLLYPWESVFGTDDTVQGIEIIYSYEREGFATGSFWWIVYLFIVSMIAAVACVPVLGVKM